jgi:hypothetical protein
MFLERLVATANDLFARFWLVVIVALPILMILGLIMKWLEK